MTRLIVIGCVVASMSIAEPSYGGGIVAKLPEDGTWATYQIAALKSAGADTPDVGFGTLRISLVGTSIEDGQRCRWIELKREEPGRLVIQKILVPEKHIKAGGDILGHVVRGWRRVEDNQPRELAKDELDRRLFLYFPGTLKDVEDLKAEILDCELGQLECVGTSGTADCLFEDRKCVGEFIARAHDKAAFGVVQWQAALTWTGLSDRVRNFGCVMTLIDQGDDAQTELPGHN